MDVDDTTMAREERALHFYQELFCREGRDTSRVGRTFTRFDAFYETKHPENLLQFPLIMQEFEECTLREIRENVFCSVCCHNSFHESSCLFVALGGN